MGAVSVVGCCFVSSEEPTSEREGEEEEVEKITPLLLFRTPSHPHFVFRFRFLTFGVRFYLALIVSVCLVLNLR